MEGASVLLMPPKDEPPRPRNVLVTVPPGMSVRIQSSDGHVVVSGLTGDLDLAGERLQVEVYSSRGRVAADVKTSTVRMNNLGSDVTVRGHDVDLRLSTVTGRVGLYLTGKVAGLQGIQSEIEADLTGVDLTVDECEGPVDLTARHGSVLVRGLRRGGSFGMTESPLRLLESGGDATVRADSDVQLRDTKGAHRLELFGGTLRAANNTGSLEIDAEGTEMVLEHISGPMRVRSRRSPLRLSDLSGELTVESIASDTTIEKASGQVSIDSDGGHLRIERSNAQVDVRSRDGDVRILNHGGGAKVRGDGRTVEVSWISIPAGQDSHVQNDGGDVTVRFLGGSGGHVSAQAFSGRIDSDLPKVVVEAGGTTAEGFVGSARQPNVVIRSSGNIELTGTDAGSDQESGR
jgi:hypothetical protein